MIEDSAHAFVSYILICAPYLPPNVPMLLFCFHPAKNITTGEGGLVVSQNESLDPIFKLYRSGGVERLSTSQFSKANYRLKEISSNYHMTELQAALGIEQLKAVDSFYFYTSRACFYLFSRN